MKHLPISFLLALLSLGMFSQIAPNKYYVQFTDKNGSPYNLENPGEFLSQRAIDRRINQGIALTVSDLPVNPAYVAGVASTGATILNTTKWFNGVTIYTNDPSVLDAINNLPYVSGVTRNSVEVSSHQEDNEVFVKEFFHNEIYNQAIAGNQPPLKQTHSFNYGQSYNQIQMLKGADFHEMGFRGQGMVIAVLDAGFLNANTLTVFDSLWMNGQILGTWDFVDGGLVTFNDHPHGSMVLSSMGGNYPGELIGTAPKASYWLLRSEDGNTEYLIEEYNWVSAAEFADSVGADVINSSLGYTTFDDPSQNHTYADMDGNTTPITRGADMAAQKGILVVNSLGNSGTSSWYYLSAPSDGDSVMGIGAVDAGGNYASFSSHGPSYDGRVKPDVVAQGSGVYVINPYDGTFTYSGGTSFSSPILAGMAACLWQAHPEYTNMQIAQAIRQTGSQYQNPDGFLGYGIPDFVQAHNILTVIDALEPARSFIQLYPNPVEQEINLVFSNFTGGMVKMELMDISGRNIFSTELMIQSNISEKVILPENLPAGIYFIQLSAGNQVYNHKLIKL